MFENKSKIFFTDFLKIMIHSSYLCICNFYLCHTKRFNVYSNFLFYCFNAYQYSLKVVYLFKLSIRLLVYPCSILSKKSETNMYLLHVNEIHYKKILFKMQQSTFISRLQRPRELFFYILVYNEMQFAVYFIDIAYFIISFDCS